MQFVITSLVSEVIIPGGNKFLILSLVVSATHELIVSLEFFLKLILLKSLLLLIKCSLIPQCVPNNMFT